MVIGSHNSWSYLKPSKWWMKLLRFTAKCQKYNIVKQYEQYGVRFFDLRLRFDENFYCPHVVHGAIQYKGSNLHQDLLWLDNKKDVTIRVSLDVRNKKSYTQYQIDMFRRYCCDLQSYYQNIKFVGGDNLYNHNNEYNFGNYVSTEELYASVTAPKLIDDWFPWLYARLHNKKNVAKGTDKEVLMIDFVNIQ